MTHKTHTIWARLGRLIQSIYTKPSLLHGQHEASFERQLHRHGIFPSKTIGYERHPNGPHRWPDFHIYDSRTLIPVELKTTKRPSVHMGGTWIQSDALYIMSHSPSVYIAWGKDMKTEQEDEEFREFQCHVKQMNRKRTFISPVKWSCLVQVQYQLEECKRPIHYKRVLDELQHLSLFKGSGSSTSFTS